MVQTPAGNFLMGSTVEEEMAEFRQSGLSDAALEEWFLAATPHHEVQVGPLLVDKFPVTMTQYEKFVEETGYRTEAETFGFGWRWDFRTQKWKRAKGWCWRCPEGPKGTFPTGSNFPVVQVGWKDAVAYGRWAGKRLLTEAEWEFVCRAGTRTRYYWGDDPEHCEVQRNAWYIGNAEGRVHRVGKKDPNPWGLFDMCGNVWEWVDDYYLGYSGTTVKDRLFSREKHVHRGGAWYFHPTYLRSAYRGTSIRGCFVGFRCTMAGVCWE
jgi:formylglycine-generating enzyme